MGYVIKPATHDVIGYKQARWLRGNGPPDLYSTKVILKLFIEKGTLVGGDTKSTPCSFKGTRLFYERKLRTEQAIVVGIYHPDGRKLKSPLKPDIRSFHDSTYKYSLGRVVVPEFPFSHSKIECASGIHFFETFKEALNY